MIPNLPINNPKCVIINPNVGNDIKDFFKQKSIDVVYTKKLKNINSSVGYHADMQIVHIIDDIYVCAPELYDYYKENLSKYGINLVSGNRTPLGNYPEDIAYNIARVGNKAFFKKDCTDDKCMDMICKRNIELYPVKQGYAKCNCLIADENSVITSDTNMEKVFKSAKVDVLTITFGDILLDGFDYGFIGGCSFRLNENTMCFLGDIRKHKDYKKIESFLRKRNINAEVLSKNRIEDFGSVILV